MAAFETHHRADGLHEIAADGHFRDVDALQLSEILQELYNPEAVSYVLIDLGASAVLPLQALGCEIMRLYREVLIEEPMFVALIVQPSIARVLGSVLKTLMRRKDVQAFTDIERARVWLDLERKKLRT